MEYCHPLFLLGPKSVWTRQINVPESDTSIYECDLYCGVCSGSEKPVC